MRRIEALRPLWLLVAALAPLLASCAVESANERFDWRDDWAASPGFTITQDSSGYSLPSALAVVPNPGPRPDDPLYFVAELRGAIKVVTNDRSVHTFATLQVYDPARELPSTEAEAGLAGICVDGARGYVFATYTYADDSGLLRNAIMRYATRPEVFALTPSETREVGAFLKKQATAVSHQIGNCQVADGALYFGVGDGENPANARKRDHLLGKVLRTTLEGEPHPRNPFYDHQAHGLGADARYVYAYGFRNPFGIQVVDGEVFIVDNGPSVDRFVHARRGEDHLWDGSDWSIAARADAVFTPPNSPVQMTFHPEGASVFPPEYRGRFYVAASGGIADPDESGIVVLLHEFDQGRMGDVPRYFVRYRGNEAPNAVATALGPDGLYFASILPNAAGETTVMRVSYDPAAKYPYTAGRQSGLIAAKGCIACHAIGSQGGQVGPRLNFSDQRLDELGSRLSSPDYLAQLARLDASSEELFVSTRAARNEVREADGQEKPRTWIRNRLLNPRFDDPTAQMPDLGLTEDEAQTITEQLLRNAAQSTGVLFTLDEVGTRVRDAVPFVPQGRAGDMIAGILIGGAAGGIGSLLLGLLVALGRRGRRTSRAGRA